MVLGVLEHETPSIFFRRILRSEALVYNSYIFFRTPVLRKLFDIRFSFKHCKFLTRLPTRQDGFENRDKVYLQKRFGYARHFEYPCRGGSRGRVQGVRTPPWDDLRFSNTTGILQKNYVVYWKRRVHPLLKKSWIRPCPVSNVHWTTEHKRQSY